MSPRNRSSRRPQQAGRTVLIDGDSYAVSFLAPSKAKEKQEDLFMSTLMVGAAFIRDFIHANWPDLHIKQILSHKFYWRTQPFSLQLLAWIKDPEKDEAPRKKAALRIVPKAGGIAGKVIRAGVTLTGRKPRHGKSNERCKVYVERDCSWPLLDETSAAATKPPILGTNVTCQYYLRIDSMETEVTARGRRDVRWSKPADRTIHAECAIAVLDTRRLALEGSIRLNSSYESIVVDVLRLLWNKPTSAKEGGGILHKLFPRLNDLEKTTLFLIVRLPLHGVLLYHQGKKPEDTKAWLFYDRKSPSPIRTSESGTMIGYGTIFAACLAARLCKVTASTPALTGAISSAIKLGIGCSHIYFEEGYCSHETAEKHLDPDEISQEYLTNHQRWLKKIKSLGGASLRRKDGFRIERIEVPHDDVESNRKSWTILEATVCAEGDRQKKEAAYKRKALEVLTQPPNQGIGTLPIITFGKQKLVERSEIEDYLSLYHAFLQYSQESGPRPLNIAVFGPPGSGKTRGVKQISEQASRSTEEFGKAAPLNFNVSQFRGPAELAAALQAVRDECLKGAIPLVFFDEFDCRFEDQDFGWFKYFLAPMEDGMFWQDSRPYRLGRCVLVFAGGVNLTFEEMNGRLRNPGFCAAKGPDFISRLRGSMNLRGVSQPDLDPDDGRYLIRRAVILHSLLVEKHGKVSLPSALLSLSLATAFMGIGNFKHGVRSMRAILDMSDFRPGKTLGVSDLPAADQLDMHVDARKFRKLLQLDPNER